LCYRIRVWGDWDKKTTTSSFLTQIYNRAKGIDKPKRLNGSIAGAEALLFEKIDCIEVLDDLFPSDFRDIKSKQEKTLEDVTRIIADGVSRLVMGNKNAGKTPTSGGMFTGEYLVGKGSTGARLLPVELWPHPDSEQLKTFQDKPLFVGNFYFNFISWYVVNYDGIQEELKKWWAGYMKERITEHDRLNEQHFQMNSAYAMFMQYLYDREFITEEEAQALHTRFQELLTLLVQVQQERADQSVY
jgi:hypothetical protein